MYEGLKDLFQRRMLLKLTEDLEAQFLEYLNSGLHKG
jgi:hypothetical protein